MISFKDPKLISFGSADIGYGKKTIDLLIKNATEWQRLQDKRHLELILCMYNQGYKKQILRAVMYLGCGIALFNSKIKGHKATIWKEVIEDRLYKGVA